MTDLGDDHYHVRWTVKADAPDILRIEAGTEAPLSWDDVRAELATRCSIGVVAETGFPEPFVAGHALYSVARKGVIEILRLEVLEGKVGAGAALALVKKLKGKLTSHQRSVITADVSDTDLATHLFLKSQGFRAEEILYATGRDDRDHYRFVYRLPGVSREGTPGQGGGKKPWVTNDW